MERLNRKENTVVLLPLLPPPSSLKLLNDTRIGRMSRQGVRCHNDTARAVNFHLAVATRKKQTYLVVSRCLSLWKMSCLYLFPSARLCALNFPLCLPHSFTLYLTFCTIFVLGRIKDMTKF